MRPSTPEMKAAKQVAASSSSSLSASNAPNPVLPRTEGLVTDPRMFADHFELGTNKDNLVPISIVASVCLDFSMTSECKKGIRIPPKKTFVYTPKKEHAVYICEAGLPEHQAESLRDETTIQVFVKSGNARSLIGNLSKKHPVVNPTTVLQDEFELSHNADKKNVYFNIYELGLAVPPPIGKVSDFAYNHMVKEQNDMWGASVSPSQKLEFRPIADGKIYNLLKVFAETTSNEDIQLFLESERISKSLGTISDQIPSIDCKLELDDTFQLSHSSRISVVHFWGFTIPYTSKLKCLTKDPFPYFEPQRSKKIVDGEYRAHQSLLAKKPFGADIKRVNLLPTVAPVMCWPKKPVGQTREAV